MHESVTLAPGIEVYRGYTIECASASNSFPLKGRFYITWLYRQGLTASFPSMQVAQMIVDALIEQCAIAQCQCDWVLIGAVPAATLRAPLNRHRNACGQRLEQIA